MSDKPTQSWERLGTHRGPAETMTSPAAAPDTPTVDAAVNRIRDYPAHDHASMMTEVARTLERANAALRHDIERHVQIAAEAVTRVGVLEGERDALMFQPPREGIYPWAAQLEATHRHAEYLANGARNEPDRETALICLHSAVNGWKNAAYAMAEKAHNAEALIAAAEADKRRYRWLKDKATRDGRDGGYWGYWVLPKLEGWNSAKCNGTVFDHTLDTAIDAAISADERESAALPSGGRGE